MDAERRNNSIHTIFGEFFLEQNGTVILHFIFSLSLGQRVSRYLILPPFTNLLKCRKWTKRHTGLNYNFAEEQETCRSQDEEHDTFA